MKTRDKYIYKHLNNKIKMTSIGLMSGTSMDGVDVSCIVTDGNNYFHQIFFASYKYTSKIKKLINQLFINKNNYIEVCNQITLFHIKSIKMAAKLNNYPLSKVDIIGFHGQTLLHKPEECWTWQIGNGKMLSNSLNIPVISNFRYRDICLGGEGAPLASLWHKTLLNSLSNKSYPCIFINIGGVSNMTYINEFKDVKYCFDIGPGNGPIDLLVNKYFNLDMDYGGKKALSGKIYLDIISKILKFKWFNKLPPKSLDKNELNSYIMSCVEGISPVDKLATLSRLVSVTLKKHTDLLNINPKYIYISGGGAHNKAIMNGIREEFNNNTKFMNLNDWDIDAIEAQAFAYLAVRSYKGLPLTENNVTGIKIDVSGGLLNFPNVK